MGAGLAHQVLGQLRERFALAPDAALLSADTLVPFASLAQEKNPELFFQSLLVWARRLESNQLKHLAAEVYRGIDAKIEPSSRDASLQKIKSDARSALSSLLGQGGFGENTERFLGQMVDAADPLALSAMAAGSLAYQGLRALTWSRMVAAPASVWSRGLLAKSAVSLIGFAVEVPTFAGVNWLGNRIRNPALAWDAASLRAELGHSLAVLAGMRIGAMVGSKFETFSSVLAPQAGMLAGLMLARRFENAPSSLSETLATLLQFNVAGRVFQNSLGRSVARWSQEVHARADATPAVSFGHVFAGAVSSAGRGTHPTPRALPDLYRSAMVRRGNGGREREETQVDNTLENGATLASPNPTPNPQATSEKTSAHTAFMDPAHQALALATVRADVAKSRQLEPGDRLGPKQRYELIRILGAGGFGQVWEVQDTRLGRTSVIKVLRQGRDDDDARVRFERETVIAANLGEKYVVPVYDQIEIAPGQQVPVMKYVAGSDLSTLLTGLSRGVPELVEKYSVEKRLEIFAKICEAVEFIHEQGVMHRDLKPANIRVATDQHVMLMDFGLARRSEEIRGEAKEKIPLAALKKMEAKLTRTGSLAGTAGYIAPELFFRQYLTDPRSPDIFSLGVILYEWMSGIHPFATFKKGEIAIGEPYRVPERGDRGNTKIDVHASLYFGSKKSKAPPPLFREIMPETPSELFEEIEAVARKAFAAHPKERYQSARELRQALWMAQARVDYKKIKKLREQMKTDEPRMHEAWKEVGAHVSPELFSERRRTIDVMIQKRNAWHQMASDIVSFLERNKRGEAWPEAQEMLAQISWDRLLDGGDRMDQIVRDAWTKRIRENASPNPKDPSNAMLRAFNEKVMIGFNAKVKGTNSAVRPGLKLRILPMMSELNAEGAETGNYKRGEPLFNGEARSLLGKISLNAGYYVFEFTHTEYAPMNVPYAIGLEDMRQALRHSRPISVDLEFIPKDRIPEGMSVIHKGIATIGHDYYRDGNVFLANSFPMKKIELPTFLVSTDPISVGDYRRFIEDLLASNVDLDTIKSLVPRTKLPVALLQTQKRGEQLDQELGENGTVFYWRVCKASEGGYRLIDPSTYLDPFDNPIHNDHPISGISYYAVEKYVSWRSAKDGKPYRVISIDEKEKIDRNGFPWTYPWGFGFPEPEFLVNRLVFPNHESVAIQPIGTHPLINQSRDNSLHGPRDLLGNVREFTSTVGNPDYVFLSGGSNAHILGGYYFVPATRLQVHMSFHDQPQGSFRLVYHP